MFETGEKDAMLIENVKRIAAILLMICFVLPLSQCEKSGKVEASPASATGTAAANRVPDRHYEVTYAYRNVSPGKPFESAITIATFFWPLAFFLLRLKPWGPRVAVTMSLAELLLCAGSAYIVYGLVLFGELLWGGYLAYLALAVYFTAALSEILLRLWRRMRPG